jgi:hypothetical protein
MYTQFNRSLIYLLAGSALSVFEELPGPSSSQPALFAARFRQAI